MKQPTSASTDDTSAARTPGRINPEHGWALLSDYREAVAALALTHPRDYTSQQVGLLKLVLTIVSAELDENAPALFGGKGCPGPDAGGAA